MLTFHSSHLSIDWEHCLHEPAPVVFHDYVKLGVPAFRQIDVIYHDEMLYLQILRTLAKNTIIQRCNCVFFDGSDSRNGCMGSTETPSIAIDRSQHLGERYDH